MDNLETQGSLDTGHRTKKNTQKTMQSTKKMSNMDP
jgi:hypothetical protein